MERKTATFNREAGRLKGTGAYPGVVPEKVKGIKGKSAQTIRKVCCYGKMVHIAITRMLFR
jgi:hypothetical protein